MQWLQVFLLAARLGVVGYVLYSPPTSSRMQSGVRNFSDGAMTTLDVIIKILAGDNGWKLPGSFIVSTVRSWEFRIPSTSVSSVRKESSSRPFILKIDAGIARAERIYFSQTPPMWLANGSLLCHFIQSPSIPSMND